MLFRTPRYRLSKRIHSQVWPSKNDRLRAFFRIRGRRLRRGGVYFRRAVLVSTTRSWRVARRRFRPSNPLRTNVRPTRIRYATRFARKEQVRSFAGKLAERQIRARVANSSRAVVQTSSSLCSRLESRLDRRLFRSRLLPTIFAARTFIEHTGRIRNGVRCYEPSAKRSLGDRRCVPKEAWIPIAGTLLGSLYYRRWGRATRLRRGWKRLRRVRRTRKGRLRWLRRRTLFTRRATVSAASTHSSMKGEGTFHSMYKRSGGFGVRSTKPSYTQRSSNGKMFQKRLYVRPTRTTPVVTQAALLMDQVRRSPLRASLVSPYGSVLTTGRVVSTKVSHHLIAPLRGLARLRKRRVGGEDKAVDLTRRRDLLARLRLLSLRRLTAVHARSSSTTKDKLTKGSTTTTTATSVRKRKGPLVRLWKNRLRGLERRRRTPRLRPVHRYTPSHLQRDVNTLRVRRIATPSDGLAYPFRLSHAALRSFYRSRGL